VVQAEEPSEQVIRTVHPATELLKRKKAEESENRMSWMDILKNLDGIEKTFGKRRTKRNVNKRGKAIRRRMMDLLDTREREGYLVLRNMGSMSGRRMRWRLCSRKLGEPWVCSTSSLLWTRN
jgi:hypothetical protein